MVPTVAKKTINIKIENQSKIYGTDNPSFTWDLDETTPLVTGDSSDVLKISLNTSATNESNVGSYDIIGTVEDASSNNYAVTMIKGTLTITQATGTVAVSEDNLSYNKTYGDNAFSLEGITKESDGNLIYSISDSKDADGKNVAQDQIIRVTDRVVSIVNAGSATITVSVPNTTNYTGAIATNKITVTIQKATPVVGVLPSVSEITYGQSLADAVLSGGTAKYSTESENVVSGAYVWAETQPDGKRPAEVRPYVSDSNHTEYAVVFVPEDEKNYNRFTINRNIVVKKSADTPNINNVNEFITPEQTCETVGAVILPTGWSWKEDDKTKVLPEGKAVTATAVYSGEDAGNYETESIEIILTKKDITPPTGEITVGTNSWYKLFNTITFNKFFKETQKVTINGADQESGLFKCYYYVADDIDHDIYQETAGMTVEDLKALSDTAWTEIQNNGTFDIDPDKKLVIYAKIVDQFDNVTFISSDGLVLDGTAPAISDVSDEETYCETATFTVTDENLDIVTVDEAQVVLKGSSYTIDGDDKSHTIIATDQAGNSTTVTIKVAREHKWGTVSYDWSDDNTKCTAKRVCENNASHVQEETVEAKSVVTTAATYEGMGERTYTATFTNEAFETQTKTESIPAMGPEPPYIVGDDGTKGWDAITSKINTVETGDRVTVDMNETTIVPGNVFEAMKGNNVDITFELENGITWTINGRSITSDTIGDIDFRVNTNTNVIPVDVVNTVTGENASMQISLAYEGVFGFTATLSINMERKNAGYYANLFYYNPTSGKLEFMNAGRINSDGSVDLTFIHASDYTIVVSDSIMNGSETNEISDKSDMIATGNIKNEIQDTISAQTGDVTDIWRYVWMFVLGAMILIIGGGVLIVKKR